jgi:hypothetical protein
MLWIFIYTLLKITITAIMFFKTCDHMHLSSFCVFAASIQAINDQGKLVRLMLIKE